MDRTAATDREIRQTAAPESRPESQSGSRAESQSGSHSAGQTDSQLAAGQPDEDLRPDSQAQPAALTSASASSARPRQAGPSASHRPHGAHGPRGSHGLAQSSFLHGRTWSFLLAVNILIAMTCCFILVWVSIERMDINYFINLERSNLREKQSLHGKLQVERERLLSPYELRIKAEKLGLKPPAPGQIRHFAESGPGLARK